jgi:hypothetical protein
MTKKKWPDDENDLTDEQVLAMWKERTPVRLRFAVGRRQWVVEKGPTGQSGYIFNYYFTLDEAGRLHAAREESEEVVKAS